MWGRRAHPHITQPKPSPATIPFFLHVFFFRIIGDWSGESPAEADAGAPVNPEVDQINGFDIISPTINPQVTGDDGYYGWDVAEGCWYITVEAEGYDMVVSPAVGVPPLVDDLDVALGSETSTFLPLITRD